MAAKIDVGVNRSAGLSSANQRRILTRCEAPPMNASGSYSRRSVAKQPCLQCLVCMAAIGFHSLTCAGEEGSCLYALPKVEDVSQIEVKLYNSPLDMLDVPRFRLPRESISKFFLHFAEASLDRSPRKKIPEIGSARIMLTSGRTVRLAWYGIGGKGPLEFSLCGERQQTAWKDPQPDMALSVDFFLRPIASRKFGRDLMIIGAKDSLVDTAGKQVQQHSCSIGGAADHNIPR